jgi:leader peptidase (prepilin peptidase)/N-methyltransferase
MLLRGRCRDCQARISVRYPLVELATGVLFAIDAWRVGATAMLPAVLVWTACLVALCAIDIDHFLLPNRVLYPSVAMVVPLVVLAAAIDGNWSDLGRAVAGAAIALAVFHALWFAAPKSLGYGDVRLSGLLGFVAAYYGWNALVTALVAPFVLGSIGGIALAAPIVLVPMGAAGAIGAASGVRIMTWIGGGVAPIDETRARITAGIGLGVFVGAFVYLVLSALRRVERGRHIPFGPYLALGAWLAVVAAA